MFKWVLDRFGHVAPVLLWILTSVAGVFVWQSHVGLSLLDEGFLWYGAQRVMLGEMPMRDFMAYDIGRYYWSAAWMSVWGNSGVVALRFAVAAFQIFSLFTALILLMRSTAKQHVIYWIAAAITLFAWMSPPYRVFDIGIPLILLGVIAFLVDRPSLHRYFLTGLTVGLVAVFGRNHGLYGVIASLSVMTYLSIAQSTPSRLGKVFAVWSAGVIVGYSPMLLLLAIDTSFAREFWESILLLFEIKATNIPLPVPWPWLAPFGQLPILRLLRGMMMGTFFIVIVLFGVVGVIWAVRKKLQGKGIPPALLAAISLALPYAHYAYSRPDIEHLAPGIIPLITGILVVATMLTGIRKWITIMLLCGASWWAMLPTYSGWICHTNPQCVTVEVAGDQLVIERYAADAVALLNKLVGQFSPNGQGFVVMPFWPGAYAVIGQKSPTWEIYALFPRSKAFQQAEIERIQASRPGFILVLNFIIGNDPKTRFSYTHPIIDRYIKDNFVSIQGHATYGFEIYKNATME